MRTIETNRGTYTFIEIELFLGRKLIDRENARKILLDFKKVLDQNKIKFGLLYGTLLGVIRENDLIAHDEDVDVYLLDEEREALFGILFELREIGLEVVRLDGDLLSIMRNGDYIDLYFYKNFSSGNRKCNTFLMKAELLEETVDYEVFGKNFTIPREYEKILVMHYGLDWRIPKINSPARYDLTLLGKVIRLVKKVLPRRLIVILKKFLKK